MDGLPGDPQRVPDLLPGPAVPPSQRYLVSLDLLGQPAQCEHRSESDGGVLSSERSRYVVWFHGVSLN
jgi:hypothetical protein